MMGSGLLLAVSCQKRPPTSLCDGTGDTTVTTTTVITTGLNDPRGLKFGPDNLLYVAEAGIGGTNAVTSCTQVIPPVGPDRKSVV